MPIYKRTAFILVVSFNLSLVFAAITFHFHSYTLKKYQKIIQNILELSELSTELIYLDEVVSLLANNAVRTQNKKSEEKYFEWAPIIDSSFKRLIDLSQEFKLNQNALEIAKTANLELIQAEENALTLYKSGQQKEALQLIENQSYLQNKKLYFNQIQIILSELKSKKEALALSAHQTTRFSEGLFLFTVGLLIFVGLWVGSRILKFETKLESFNEELEEKIKIRTLELENEKEITLKAAKLISIGEMSATIAHDIANPLTVIQARAHRIRKIMTTPEVDRIEIEKNISSILGMTHRILTLIQNIKDFSRTQSKETPQNFSNNDLVKECIELVSDKAHKLGVKITLENRTSQNWYGPRNTLTQISMNLLSNAIDAASSSHRQEVKITFSEEGNKSYLRFYDSGSGVPTHVGDKIFDPLFSTKPRGVGSGLGLSIVKRLIEGLNGSITYYRTADNWTCFEISFPSIATDLIHSNAA